MSKHDEILNIIAAEVHIGDLDKLGQDILMALKNAGYLKL